LTFAGAEGVASRRMKLRIRVKATGAHPGKVAGEQEPFTEETTSVLVFENGGVIRLSAAVVPGQLLFLINQESECGVVAQVIRKRSNQPTSCYVELEFAEPASHFWGMEFSAAAALLPKDIRDAEVAAMVMSAETTADEPGEPPPAVSAERVQALKGQVEVVREQPTLVPTPTASEQFPAPPQSPEPAAILVPSFPLMVRDVASTDLDLKSGADDAQRVAITAKSLPFEQNFTAYLPKARRSLRVKGSFTPGFQAGALRLAVLTTALVITASGAVLYKHWIPRMSATKKVPVIGPARAVNTKASTQLGSPGAVQVHSASSNTNGTNSALDPSLVELSQRAALHDTTVPKAADAAVEFAVQPSASSEAVAKPAAMGASLSTALAGTRSTVASKAKDVSDSVVPSAVESVFVPPKLIKSARAVASLDALRDFETGNVVIDTTVGTSGEVSSINILSGPHSLRDSAVETLKQYRYEPATQNGQLVPAHITVTIRFRFEP
jgi:TonB family protein